METMACAALLLYHVGYNRCKENKRNDSTLRGPGRRVHVGERAGAAEAVQRPTLGAAEQGVSGQSTIGFALHFPGTSCWYIPLFPLPIILHPHWVRRPGLGFPGTGDY